MNLNSQVAIIGWSIICAAGYSDKDFFETTVEQKDPKNCRQIPSYLFKTTLEYPAFFLKEKIITQKEVWEFINPFLEKNSLVSCPNRTVELLLQCLYTAIVDANIEPKDLKNKKVGIIIGTTVGSTFNNEAYYKSYRNGKDLNLIAIKNYLSSNLAQVIQSVLGVQGPCMVINNACASGTDAIGIGSIWLKSGICDIVIAGGADELSRIAYLGFSNLQLASKFPCRPFDIDRKGLNLGEGAALMILSLYKNCTQTKGFILGYGCIADAYHPTAPHPRGEGLKKAIKQAITQADIDIEAISMINAHGTGTMANDYAEAAALEDIFGDSVAIVSTKGVTGHCLGAAGAIEALWTVYALNNRLCPGTIGLKHKDPNIKINILPQNKHVRLKNKIGISQSLAFGGGNSCIVLMGKD